MGSLVLVEPIAGKGLGREFLARPDGALDSRNYVELGVAVLDDDGHPVRDAEVSVECRFAGEDPVRRVMDGTGTVGRIDLKTGKGGNAKGQVPYYPLRYEFIRKGRHRIAFRSEGCGEAIRVTVDVEHIDDRPDPSAAARRERAGKRAETLAARTKKRKEKQDDE